jgi:glycosyltransferase involved in cell wall biosynthesis
VRRRALLVSPSNPYPVVRDGCRRLVLDYVDTVLDEEEVYFLHVAREDWAPLALFRDGTLVRRDLDPGDLLLDFDFALFVGFKDTTSARRLAARQPAFCFTDTFPHPDVPRERFCGILSHRSLRDDANVVLVGGSFNDAVFRPDRRAEEHVLCVGRIHPDKNQLELVADYRKTIYERFGLPLLLVGGAEDVAYYERVSRYVDGVSVISTIADPARPLADANWRSAQEVAALCNRARLFVSASPKESFSMAMIEAMACGTTCVVNGDYWGFPAAELGPNVIGNVTGRRGSTLELLARALRDGVRVDGSAWARRFALRKMRDGVRRFIDARL